MKVSKRLFAAAVTTALLAPAALLAVDADNYALGYSDPDFWYDLAVEEYDEGSYEAATRHFKKATECGLTMDVDFYILWGDAYYMLARESGSSDSPALREAIKTYSGCIFYQDGWEVRSHRAQAYLLQGSYDAALEDIALAIQRNSESAGLWAVKGDIYTAMGDGENAERCYYNARSYSGQNVEEPAPQPSHQSEPAQEPAYSPEPSSRTPEQLFAQSLFDIGDRAFAQGDWATAVAGYQEGLVSDPGATHYRRRLGDSYLKLGRQRAADSCYARADGTPWPPQAAAPAPAPTSQSPMYDPFNPGKTAPAPEAKPSAAPSAPPSAVSAGKGERLWDKDGSVMVKIPAGEFLMGSAGQKVYLDEYWIDRYEVTNRQYRKFCEATGHEPPEDQALELYPDHYARYADHPVIGVSWEDAASYAAWAGKRLPTEAEWERAAGGTDGRKYPWGNDEPDANGVYRANGSGGADGATDGPAAVGSYPAGRSACGAYDMAGNVWEWCQDWYGEYSSGQVRNPTGPESGGKRCTRGGSWSSLPAEMECAKRDGTMPHIKCSIVGFRCAADGE